MVEHLPYCGLPPYPGQLLQRFNFDPVLLGSLGLLAWLQCAGARTRREHLCAAGGWSIAAAALISPLCALSVSLVSARIAQHMVLLGIAAPLIALGWSRPMRSAERAVNGAALIWIASAAFFIALWFWYMPSPYQATFDSSHLYWVMHSSLFASALLLWRALLQSRGADVAVPLTAGAVGAVQMGLLGTLLILAPQPLYEAHLSTTAAWGLKPLQDQQLGGFLIALPSIALLFALALHRSVHMRHWRSAPG